MSMDPASTVNAPLYVLQPAKPPRVPSSANVRFGAMLASNSAEPSRVSNVALAKRMGVDERAVRRLLDVSQRSHIGEIERALSLLGRWLEVEAHAA